MSLSCNKAHPTKRWHKIRDVQVRIWLSSMFHSTHMIIRHRRTLIADQVFPVIQSKREFVRCVNSLHIVKKLGRIGDSRSYPQNASRAYNRESQLCEFNSKAPMRAVRCFVYLDSVSTESSLAMLQSIFWAYGYVNTQHELRLVLL